MKRSVKEESVLKQNQDPIITDIKKVYSKNQSASPLKEKKEKKLIKIKWVVLVCFFSFMMVAAIYFITPYSKIGSITVEGTEEVLDQEVINSSGVRAGESLWENYFERDSISRNITDELPQIKELELSISGFHDITVNVTEYQTVAYLAKESQYYKILENGTILVEEYPATLSDLPIMIGFTDEEVLQQLLTEYNSLDGTVKAMISEMEWVESDRNPLLVKAYMNNGNEILASIPSFSERMKHYPQLVKAINGENGLFDLEAGAYFIPFSKDDDQKLDEESGIELEESTSE